MLFHAGRGIPHLGEAVVDLARRYPGARLILYPRKGHLGTVSYKPVMTEISRFLAGQS